MPLALESQFVRDFLSGLGGRAARLADPFVPPSIREQGLEAARRARLVVGVGFVGAALVVLGSLNAHISGTAAVSHWPLAFGGLLLLVPFVLRWTGSLPLSANLIVAAIASIIAVGNFARAGIGQQPLLASAIVPLVAMLLGGWRVGLAWGGLVIVQVSFLVGVYEGQFVLPAFLTPPPEMVQATRSFRAAAELIVVLGLALIYDALKTRSLRELEETRDRAERADRLKSAFVASLSHEVRTPLSVIIGMSDILLDSDLDDDQREIVRTLRRSGGNLLGLVNDVLDLSKIEAGRLEIESIPFDVAAVTQDVQRQLEHAASEKRIALDVAFGKGVPTRVYGDPGRVRQVLTNLVGNAIKFTSEGGVEVEVVVEKRDRDEVILGFAVTDTGVGIPADEMPRLFERYTQIDASTARVAGGSGLGLPISQELVSRMKGRLIAQSQPGHGSRFSFSLPLRVAEVASSDRPPQAPAVPVGEPETPFASPRRPTESAPAGQRAKVSIAAS